MRCFLNEISEGRRGNCLIRGEERGREQEEREREERGERVYEVRESERGEWARVREWGRGQWARRERPQEESGLEGREKSRGSRGLEEERA